MNAEPSPRTHVHSTSDGVTLIADLWEAADPRGIVVIRTPYDARQHAAIGRSWVERGYHCLIQDVRGRYRSNGEWRPYHHEGHDGAGTIIALRRSYPGLPVITFGASYAAHAALETARGIVLRGGAAPAAIIALVPTLGLAETAWDDKGDPQIEHRIGWWHEHGQSRLSQPPLISDELERRITQANHVGPVVAARQWGWTEHTLEQWTHLWSAKKINPGDRYSPLAAPLLIITGDHDFFYHDAIRLFQQWPAERHLVTGPWGHNLANDITNPQQRSRLRETGGIGGMIDVWLAKYGLSEHTTKSAHVSLGTVPTTSWFNPVIGAWQHERNTA